jgi:small subunit ribosomal protein S2
MSIKTPSVKELFDADVHLGHPVRRWNPKMEPYIYDVHNGSHIINLEKTQEKLEEATNFLFEVGKNKGQVIFVGTKKQISEMLQKEAEAIGALYVVERWLGGTLTNYSVIKERIDTLVQMRKKRDAGEYDMYTKKEQLLLDREITKLEISVGGLVGIRGLPQALVVIDAHREKTAVREAKKRDVPVVALIDTDTNPEGIDYVIPGNDDAIKSISFITKTLVSALEEGYKAAEKEAEKAAKKEEKAKKAQEMAQEKAAKEAAKEKEKEKEAEASKQSKETKKETKEDKEPKESDSKKTKKTKKKSTKTK